MSILAISEFAESKNRECVIETMRIMGNLSRSTVTRSYIAESEVFQALLGLLEKGKKIYQCHCNCQFVKTLSYPVIEIYRSTLPCHVCH